MEDKGRVHVLEINRDKIRKYWKKSDLEVAAILEEIKNWIKTQNFIEMPTDSMLEFFLTNNKYNVESTTANIKTYYTVRKQFPVFFQNSNPRLPEMQETWNMGVYCPLPKLHEDLYRVSIITINPYKPNFNVCKYWASLLNIYELRICEDLCNSEILILDYEHYNWRHLIQMSPFLVHKLTTIAESLARTRVKQIHVLNSPSYVNLVLNIAKKFLKKLRSRIFIHETIDTVYEYVPKELLPSDYGGNEKSLDELIALWKQKIEEYQDRFDLLEKFDKEE